MVATVAMFVKQEAEENFLNKNHAISGSLKFFNKLLIWSRLSIKGEGGLSKNDFTNIAYYVKVDGEGRKGVKN